MTFQDIKRLADEIASANLVRDSIVSVEKELHDLTERKASDSLARYGIVSHNGRYEIRVFNAVDVQPESVYSVVVVRRKWAKIIIAAHNVCWTRMAKAKEYAHLYAGLNPDGYQPNCEQDDPLDLLLTAARTARQNLPEHDNEEIPNDEMACFYLAIEILLPDKNYPGNVNLRKEAIAMHARNPTDYLSVARRFRIPEKIITHIFEGGYVGR